MGADRENIFFVRSARFVSGCGALGLTDGPGGDVDRVVD